MRDVTAQEFREAVRYITMVNANLGGGAIQEALLESARLLLAAAEQREQLDATTKLAYLGEHHFPDLTWKARFEELREDFATLTAERDEAQRTMASAMASALATIADVIAWAERNDYGKDADGDLWHILKAYDTLPAPPAETP
jgi:hypothetical protein